MTVDEIGITIEDVARWAGMSPDMLTHSVHDLRELNVARKRMDDFQIELNRVLSKWEKRLRDTLGTENASADN